MVNRNFTRVMQRLLTILMVMGLFGCGAKGDLYLPEEPQQEQRQL